MGAVIRPGYITGDPASGIQPPDDFLVRLWKGCLQVGARPDMGGNGVNTVPVQQVASIVVAAAFHLSTATDVNTAVAQVSNKPQLRLNEWIGAVEAYGYKLPMVPYKEWCTKVIDYVNDDTREEHALLPLFHFVVGNLPQNTIAAELSTDQATAALELYGGNPAASAVDMRSIGMYLAYLVTIGFLPAPAEKGELELPQVDEERIRGMNADMGGRSAKR